MLIFVSSNGKEGIPDFQLQLASAPALLTLPNAGSRRQGMFVYKNLR